METPFYKYSWNQKPRPRYSSPKVVSIPVHFITSQKSQSQSQSSSALKIQKVFRGYLVRKNVNKILCIKREVDEVEKKLLENETVELIRKDSKERIRINETLMSLLFKLDSISGVNSIVRDCRKAAIKKAVGLQERVDQIMAEFENVESQGIESDQTNPIEESANCLIDSESFNDRNAESQGNESQIVSIDRESDEYLGTANSIDINLDLINMETEKSVEENLDFGVESKGNSINANDFNSVSIECSFDCNNKSDLQTENVFNDTLDSAVESEDKAANENVVDDISALAVKSECNTLDANAFVGGLVECDKKLDLEDNLDGEDCVVKEIVEDVNVKGNGECLVEEESDDKQRNRELLEKVMVDNQKMMSLMSQLCDRNEMQTKMLSCLTQRVEQLEKAFVCEKIRRKKKRNGV